MATLDKEIFGIAQDEIQAKIPVIHQVVVAQLAAARQGTHKTKTRSEVSGGGKKPFRQKGTGRARQGSTRAPHMIGGGVVHGPVPRDYSQRTPKKVKALALRLALSDRANAGAVFTTADFGIAGTPSAKAASKALASITPAKTILVVVSRPNDDETKVAEILSLRNLAHVELVFADQINVYSVLSNDAIVFTDDAYKEFVNSKKEASK
jgi:large subunit ribosomal protein L4